MPCCEYHDRLGSKLHSVECIDGSCGSIKLETLVTLIPGLQADAPIPITNPAMASEGAVPALDPSSPHRHVLGYGKPYYCCFECPTLLAKLGVPAP